MIGEWSFVIFQPLPPAAWVDGSPHIWVEKLEKANWVAVVNLNTKDANGYLQGELPRCKLKEDKLIAAEIKVDAFYDKNNCCGEDGNKD